MCEGDKDALLALPFYVLLLCCLSMMYSVWLLPLYPVYLGTDFRAYTVIAMDCQHTSHNNDCFAHCHSTVCTHTAHDVALNKPLTVTHTLTSLEDKIAPIIWSSSNWRVSYSTGQWR